MRSILLPVEDSGRYGNVPITWTRDGSKFVCEVSSNHVTKTQQVAVKALMVYSADQVGEAKEKKIKVRDSIKVCIDYLCQALSLYRGYGANSKYVLYSIIEIFCLFMVGHPALAHSSRSSVPGQRTET